MRKLRKLHIRTAVSMLLICVMTLAIAFGPGSYEAEASGGVVNDRFSQVAKDFKNYSRINKLITVNTIVNDNGGWDRFGEVENGGCNALVVYVTMKIFHDPYVPDSSSYKKIGSTVSGSNSAALKKLFKKAKKGDVIRLHNGTNDFHFAIFMGVNSGGVRVYEGNYGGKNVVRYNHQWTWNQLRTWRRNGMKYKVSVYRARNYNPVNSGKAAKNLKKGATFKYKGITYKVTKAGIRNAKVKVIKKDDGAGATPKAIGINYDSAKKLIRFGEEEWDYFASDAGEKLKIRAYKKDKGRYYDEQYFTVE